MKTRISLLTILSVMLICLSGCSNKKEFEEFSNSCQNVLDKEEGFYGE